MAHSVFFKCKNCLIWNFFTILYSNLSKSSWRLFKFFSSDISNLTCFCKQTNHGMILSKIIKIRVKEDRISLPTSRLVLESFESIQGWFCEMSSVHIKVSTNYNKIALLNALGLLFHKSSNFFNLT